LCTNTPEGAGAGAAGGAADGAAGDVSGVAEGFSLLQAVITMKKTSKATDAARWNQCDLDDWLQIIPVHLSDGFRV